MLATPNVNVCRFPSNQSPTLALQLFPPGRVLLVREPVRRFLVPQSFDEFHELLLHVITSLATLRLAR